MKLIWAYLPESVADLADALIDKMGTSKSEYLRQLIIADLDRRSVFTTQLKAELLEKATAEVKEA